MKAPLFCSAAFLASVMMAGCLAPEAPWPSDQQRFESFHPYEGHEIDGEPIWKFAKQRTAVVVSGEGVKASVLHSAHRALTLEFDGEPNSWVDYAHAEALEPDGYFLTAAHCIDHPVKYLVYCDGQSAKAVVPRVVAELEDRSRRLDIAVIHVPDTLPHVLALADMASNQLDGGVIGVGGATMQTVTTNCVLLKLTCFAGRVQEVRSAGGRATVVFSNLPTRGGDSGGPVITRSGRLVGVHSATRSRWLRGAQAVAVRPDPSWLARVIEQDRLTNECKRLELPVSTQASPGEPTLVISFE